VYSGKGRGKAGSREKKKKKKKKEGKNCVVEPGGKGGGQRLV